MPIAFIAKSTTIKNQPRGIEHRVGIAESAWSTTQMSHPPSVANRCQFTTSSGVVAPSELKSGIRVFNLEDFRSV